MCFYSKIKVAFLSTFVLIITSNLAFSQNEIAIRFIGNAALHLTDGNTNLYIDFPYKSGAHKYMEYDTSEINNIKDNAYFLFTHRHADHYSKKLLKKVCKDKNHILGNWNIEHLNNLNNSIPDFSIKAIKTSHKFTFKHFSYVITWHGKTIYISGDTGSLNELNSVNNIDWAFINPWIYINAHEENVKLNAKMIGIYHLYPFQELPDTKPDNVLFLMEQGKVITIPYSKRLKTQSP